MPQEYNGFTIPIYAESADAVLAFTDYTDDVVSKLALKAPSTGIATSAVTGLDTALASKTDLAMIKNAQTGTSYSYALADQTKLLTMSNAAANTVTLTKQATVTWAADTQLRVLNIGAGATTLVADTGVTINNNTALAQWRGGVLIRMSSDVWTFVPFASGVGAANFSDAATGTYTGYKYLTFTSSGTITITTAGFADVVLLGGGGGAASGNIGSGGGGGGAGGALVITNAYLGVGTLTVTVGSGGVGAPGNGDPSNTTGQASRLGSYFSPGGGIGNAYILNALGQISASGGGGSGYAGGAANAGGTGTPGIGFDGGAGFGTSPGATTAGGGGGGGGAVGGAASSNQGGAGGAGTSTAIAGTTPSGSYVAGSYAFAGGGGGSGVTGGSATDGGGAGINGTGTNGTANKGGGGGAGRSAAAGNGGSGIVIVRVAA